MLAIIPARAGSKGIPGKNMRMLGGTPLIAHTIRAALGAASLSHTVVSTDSPEIAAFATSEGIPTFELRPPHLSTDTASSRDVVRYEVDGYSKRAGLRPAHVVLLQPTSPLRTAAHVDAAVSRYLDSGAQSLISVCDAGPNHPDYMYRANGAMLERLLPGGSTRRQDLEPVFVRNGAIYITSVDYLDETGALVADRPAFYVMDRRSSINIDALEDLVLAEGLFAS